MDDWAIVAVAFAFAGVAGNYFHSKNTRNNSAKDTANLRQENETLHREFEELRGHAGKLGDRMDVMERILDAEVPNWRNKLEDA